MKTPNTAANIRHFLDELQAPAKELSQWEEGFVVSVGNQFEERGTLSDKQFEILERIYAEKTA